jgi:hypothetical protein
VEFNLCGDQDDDHLKRVAQELHIKAAEYGNEIITTIVGDPPPADHKMIPLFEKNTTSEVSIFDHVAWRPLT